MRLRMFLTCALCAAMLFVAAAPAYGDLYYVSASEGRLEAAETRLSGVAADSWVLFDPHEIYSLHVNSVYVWLDTGDYVEAGWAWYAGDGPQAFVAYERKGHTTDQERIWLGPVDPGSWVHIEIANPSGDASGPVRWECRVGDKTAAVYQDFARGTLRVSSERQTYRDSGLGRFAALRRLDADGRWSPWVGPKVQSGDQDYQGFTPAPDVFDVR